MKQEFTSSLDLTTKTITVVAVILLLGTASYNVWRLSVLDASGTPRILSLILAIGVFCLLAGTWAYRVAGYALDGESLIVQRPIGNRKLSLKDIEKVIVPPTGTMRWSLRTFGNGGIFGFTGYYANTAFGSMRWFATRTSNYIIVQLKDGEKIVITPDDTGMVSAIREQAGLPAV